MDWLQFLHEALSTEKDFGLLGVFSVFSFVELAFPIIAVLIVCFSAKLRNVTNAVALLEISFAMLFVALFKSNVIDFSHTERLTIYSTTSLLVSLFVVALRGNPLLAFGFALAGVSNAAALVGNHHYMDLREAIVDRQTYDAAVSFYYGEYAQIKLLRGVLAEVAFLIQIIGIACNDMGSIERRRRKSFSSDSPIWLHRVIYHFAFKYLSRKALKKTSRRLGI